MAIKLDLASTPKISLQMSNAEVDMPISQQIVVSNDYDKLRNKPQINGQELEAGDNTIDLNTEIGLVVYGEDSSEYIEGLYQEGRWLICEKDGMYYSFLTRENNSSHSFAGVTDLGQMIVLTCAYDAWTFRLYEIPGVTFSAPLMDGTASAGSAPTWARGDHVHPTDTSRAPIANPNFTGTPTADTAASGTATRQLATTEYVTKANATIPFGVCDDTSTSTVFTATVPGITELKNGVIMFLTNGVVTSASGFTLNINGLGAKPVYNSMAAATRITTTWNVAYTMLFVYNEGRVEGGCWDMYYGYNSDTNTIAYNVKQYNGAYKCKTALYRYQMLYTVDEEYVLPTNAVSNSTGTNKTLTTEEFLPWGDIFYYSTTTAVSADATVGATNLYTQYSSVDMRYSFNCGKTLTAGKDVFLVCAPQSNGKVKLHSNPLSQSLPTTEDGLVYIKLGRAYSTYQISLNQNKPVYYYKAGAIRIWTNPE